MAKTTSLDRSLKLLGLGTMTILGFVFGLALFLLLYGWYLAGYTDTTALLTTAILLIIVIYVILYIAYWMGSKYGMAYEKAVYMGIGFTIALIVASIILGYLGLATPIAVGAVTIAERIKV
jgi:hypothetical protein